MTIQLLHAAIVKAKSADIAAVRAALPGLKTNSIVGEVEMRAADQQLLRPLALTEVTKGSDGMGVITLKSAAPAGQITPPIRPDCKM
jgi:branched-chain amino acid transport system substrate-binding protein